MKIKSLFIATLYSAVILFAVSSCSSKKEETAQEESHDEAKHEDAEATTDATAPQFQVDAKFQQQLNEVFASYILLKDAFVATDAAKVKEAASKTLESLSKVDMMLLTGAAHHDWMTFEGGLKTALSDMQASSDMEVQRASFSKLSDTMYKSIKAYGLGGATAYYEFCPMAFNNEGGYWLSDASEIRNPYFGDKMLTCGSVQEKLN